MNLIFGTLALLSFRCLGVFGDCVTKPSDTDKFMDSCDSWFTAKESCGIETRANPRRYELLFRPASARRYELLVRPDELLVRPEEKDTEVMVDVKVYRGNEPTDKNSLVIGTKSSYNASISSDCWMNITVLQPRVSVKNAEVIFSANNTVHPVTLSQINVTFLRLEASGPFSVCSRGSQEHWNGHNKNSGSNDEEETRDETPVAGKGHNKNSGSNDEEETHNETPVTRNGKKLRPTNEEAHSHSTTDGCNNTVTTVLGVLLALSLLINKFFVIRFGLRKICSRRSDEGPTTNPANHSQGLGNFARANSAQDSENSLYGAVINRKY